MIASLLDTLIAALQRLRRRVNPPPSPTGGGGGPLEPLRGTPPPDQRG